MDRVRFGRALGEGARHAARTLKGAAEAAVAPDPRAAHSPAAPQVRADDAGRAVRRSVLTPVKTFSRRLWLEVTGTFFALIAVGMGRGVWGSRGAWHASPHTIAAQKLYVFAAIFVAFVYFAISSFVRASRVSRR